MLHFAKVGVVHAENTDVRCAVNQFCAKDLRTRHV